MVLHMSSEKVRFRVINKEEYTIVHFDLEDIIEPSVLKDIHPPKVNGTKGVVLSGRGPIWLYCFLAHYYHPTRFLATYDPRLGGAVVTQTHDPNYHVGEIIVIEGFE